jgi:hypothetical protein
MYPTGKESTWTSYVGLGTPLSFKDMTSES